MFNGKHIAVNTTDLPQISGGLFLVNEMDTVHAIPFSSLSFVT